MFKGTQVLDVHGHVSGTGRYRTGFVAITSHQMGGIVPAHSVDDLRDLIQAQSSGSPGVVQSAQITRENRSDRPVQTISVGRRAHFVIIQCGGQRFHKS